VFEFEVDPAAALLTCAQDQVRTVAAAQQRQTAALAELWALRVQQDLAAGANHAEAGEFAVTEMAAALCTSRRSAGDLAALGMALESRLPAVRRAWAAGELDLARVRVLVERTQDVAPENLEEVERLILERARTTPAGRLGRVVDRIVTRVEPEAVVRRREAATLDRRVVVSPAPDGMAEVWGRLPAVDGRVLDQRLDGMARSVCPEDPRTHAARRADALTSLAAGVELTCRCGCDRAGERSSQPRVQLIITGPGLFGDTDEPGFLLGHGPVDAPLVSSVAADADWSSAAVDPCSGALVDLRPFDTAAIDLDDGPLRYSPGAALARLVRLRDGACRFPGCGVPAQRCDLDHLVPFDRENPERGGRTVRDNLFCLCRYHHRAKTVGVWSYEHHGGGRLSWMSPTGGTYESSAHDYGGIVDSRTPTCHGGS
jgi:hypothetical protein